MGILRARPPVAGSARGLALWAVNFKGTAPVLFPQFELVNQTWNGNIARTFSLGTALGACAVTASPGDSPVAVYRTEIARNRLKVKRGGRGRLA